MAGTYLTPVGSGIWPNRGKVFITEVLRTLTDILKTNYFNNTDLIQICEVFYPLQTVLSYWKYRPLTLYKYYLARERKEREENYLHYLDAVIMWIISTSRTDLGICERHSKIMQILYISTLCSKVTALKYYMYIGQDVTVCRPIVDKIFSSTFNFMNGAQ